MSGEQLHKAIIIIISRSSSSSGSSSSSSSRSKNIPITWVFISVICFNNIVCFMLFNTLIDDPLKYEPLILYVNLCLLLDYLCYDWIVAIMTVCCCYTKREFIMFSIIIIICYLCVVYVMFYYIMCYLCYYMFIIWFLICFIYFIICLLYVYCMFYLFYYTSSAAWRPASASPFRSWRTAKDKRTYIVYMYMYVCIYIYIYIDREREIL